jgi:hypothetical protein
MGLGRAAAAMAVMAAVVMGCGSAGGSASSPGPNGTAAGEAPSSTATGPEVWLPEWADARTPAAVVNRRPLPLCGVEEAPVPRPGEFIDATVRNCFWAAKLDGREAEFVSVQPTMEGDRIATIYRLRPDGGVDVMLDSTQDRFGGGGWTLTTCDKLVEEAGERLFAVDGCGEGQAL